jgi:hypothetical protein
MIIIDTIRMLIQFRCNGAIANLFIRYIATAAALVSFGDMTAFQFIVGPTFFT